MDDEIKLLQAAQAGDDDAFAALYDALAPSVRHFVNRMMGERAAADDIVQLTFIALYRNLSRVDADRSPRPYVFRIARNRCLDELRALGRYDSLSDDEDVHVRVSFTVDSPPNPEDAVHWLLVRLEVMNAVDALPERQREALILFAEAGLSVREIAEATDTPEGTVKSRLYHARQGIRRRLHPGTLQSVETLFQEAPNHKSVSENEEEPYVR